MVMYIANFFTYFIEMLTAYMYFSDFLTKKCKTSTIIIYGTIIYSVISVINISFDSNIAINISLFIVANVIFCLLCYKAMFKKALLHSILLTTVMTVTEFFSIYMLLVLLDSDMMSYKTDFSEYVLDVTVSKMLYIVVCKVITKLIPQNKIKGKVPFYLFIYPFCSMIVLILFRKISILYPLSNEINTLISIISFLSLIAIIVTYILYSNTIKRDNKLFELNNELNKIEVDRTYYELLEHKNEEMHIFVHDTKNHLSTIKALANNSIIDEYIDKINSDLNKCTPKCTTNNKIMDLILNKYSDLCKINKIEFYTIIKTANLNYMNEMDLSSFLNNILSNAYEAAIKSTEKRIELSINKMQGFDVLTCTNSCDKKPIIKDHILVTSKDDNTFHGYGIKSIKKIVKKYDGNYEWSYDPIEKEFTTSVIFKI